MKFFVFLFDVFSMSFRWPKLTFPTFRVLEAKCLQNFRIDEQICLLRSGLTNSMFNLIVVIFS